LPTKYNPRALEAYYQIMLELPDAYPASANSLATVLSLASGIAGRLWPMVRTGLDALLGDGKREVSVKSVRPQVTTESSVKPKPKRVKIAKQPSRSRSRQR
jgi:hypothetical protein